HWTCLQHRCGAFIRRRFTRHGESSTWPGVAAESAIMNEDTIQIGTRELWGQNYPVSIALPDLRSHVYVIGKTGSGKTTLLRNMILQHLYQGHGLALLDPHGDLAEELLDHFPTARAD